MNKIAPCLWFGGCAEEAARFYVAAFPGGRITSISRYGDGAPFPAGTALMVEFELAGQRFQALNGQRSSLDSAAISLSISASDAADVDQYWQALTAGGGREGRCGWLTDRFGISWQVVPDGLGAVKSDPDPARAARAMQALLAMGKLDLAALQAAAAGPMP